MKTIVLLAAALTLLACGAEPYVEHAEPPSEAPPVDSWQPPPLDDAGDTTCPACETCPRRHDPGIMRCDELDPVFPTACEGLKASCFSASCPIDFPDPQARALGVQRPAHCLEGGGGVPACTVPGVNNTIFVDCCATNIGAPTPVCGDISECPMPKNECWGRWCIDKACVVSMLSAGTPCSIGHCESGWCVP